MGPADGGVSLSSVEEDIVIYKLPGEKLGLGLRFDGGGTSTGLSTGSLPRSGAGSETVRRLFVQVSRQKNEVWHLYCVVINCWHFCVVRVSVF